MPLDPAFVPVFSNCVHILLKVAPYMFGADVFNEVFLFCIRKLVTTNCMLYS